VRFVLAYQYICQGHEDAAVGQLKQVIALMPADKLSNRLLATLSPKDSSSTPAAPSTTPGDTSVPAGATLAGTWMATPRKGTTIQLTVNPDNAFTWQVDQQGKKNALNGTATFGENVLTLAQNDGPPLVGRVTWKDAQHMNFRILGDQPTDPGVDFSK
jgi:hypothetical protein